MEHVHTATTTLVDVEPVTMRWGAIVAGWLVATAVASLMYVAGLAIGFSAFDPYNSTMTAKGIGMGTVAWIVLTWAVSLLLGGMFASWFVARQDQTVGALHGITVWGLSVVAGGLLFAMGSDPIRARRSGAVEGRRRCRRRLRWSHAAMGPRAQGGPMGDAITGLAGAIDPTRRTDERAQRAGRVAGRSGTSSPAQTGPRLRDPAATAQPSGADVRQAASQLDRQTMASVAAALINGNTDNAKALVGRQHVDVAGRNRSNPAGSFGPNRQVQG